MRTSYANTPHENPYIPGEKPTFPHWSVQIGYSFYRVAPTMQVKNIIFTGGPYDGFTKELKMSSTFMFDFPAILAAWVE